MTSGLVKLFGSATTLVRNNGTSVPIADIGQLTYVLFYFSAHWCPPCKRFTPMLIDFYNELRKTRQDVEVIFLSSDKSSDEFAEYFGTMPWLALPFEERAVKTKLSGKFKVEGIPTLISLNKDGEVLCRDAVMHVAEGVDRALANLPWTPPTLSEILQKATLTSKGGDVVSFEALQALDSFALYFSAHWCGPCRAFTPQLIKIYEKLKARNANMELFFVSSDRSEKEFDEYYGTMPWATLQFGSPAKDDLSSHCRVDGIPSLVTVDAKTMQVVNFNARSGAMADPAGENFPWVPKPLPLVTTLEMDEDKVRALNENCCFFLSLPEDASLDNFKDVIDSFNAAASIVDAARKDIQGGDDLKVTFFHVDPGEGSELLQRVIAVTQAPVGALKGKPFVLAARLGPSKVVDVLGEQLNSADSIVSFSQAFYKKAVAEDA